MTEQDLMYASDEDIRFYLNAVHGLPTLAGLDGSGNGSDGIQLPFGLGSHSVRCLREIVDIVKPKHIFEIGLNMGWSAAMWLELTPEAKLMSCDISKKQETCLASEILRSRYGSRFNYFNRITEKERFLDYLFANEIDLAFIDGGHLLEDVKEDIQQCLVMGIPCIAFDDFLPQFGQVKEAIDTFGDKLEQLNINGNIALYKNKTL